MQPNLPNAIIGYIPENQLTKPNPAINDQDIPNFLQVKQLVEGNLSELTIKDVVYDDTSNPAVINGSVFVINDYIFVYETVGSFLANKVYRCTAAGTIATATFELKTLKDNTKIDFLDTFINPNDAQQIYYNEQIYKYVQGTDSFEPVESTINRGIQFITTATLNFNNSSVTFNRKVPKNSYIRKVSFRIVTPLNGTGGVFKLGHLGSLERIIPEGLINLHSYTIPCYFEFVPQDVTLGGIIKYLTTEQLIASLSGVTGGTAGKIEIDIEFLTH